MTIREKDEYTLDLAIKKRACDFSIRTEVVMRQKTRIDTDE